MAKIRVALIGVGNCASSLVQGIEFYRGATGDRAIPGIMHLDLGGYHIAEKLSVPSFAVSIAPFTRTRTISSINFPEKKLGSVYNLLTHRLTEQIFFMPPSSQATAVTPSGGLTHSAG